MEKVTYVGGVHVKVEAGNALSVEPTVGHLVLSNGMRVQVKRGFATLANNDTTEMIPAQATLLYRVLSMVLITGSVAPTVTFKSGTDAISPGFTLAADGGFILPPNMWGWFQTLEINKALQATVSNSAAVMAQYNYIELTTDLFDLL